MNVAGFDIPTEVGWAMAAFPVVVTVCVGVWRHWKAKDARRAEIARLLDARMRAGQRGDARAWQVANEALRRLVPLVAIVAILLASGCKTTTPPQPIPPAGLGQRYWLPKPEDVQIREPGGEWKNPELLFPAQQLWLMDDYFLGTIGIQPKE